MKVKDYVSVIKDEVNVNVVYDGKKITEFKAPYWDTIESDILGLEIREVKYPGKSIVIETQTGRPTIVSTAAELTAAIANENIKFIKLGADIEDSDEREVVNLEKGCKTLDLAGHTLSTADGLVIAVTDATLDIFDSEGGGLVSGYGSMNTIIVYDDGVLRIHNGDYVGGTESASNVILAYGSSSSVSIYGGYFNNLYSEESEDNTILAVTDGKIACYGGKFKAEDPSEYVADGYQAVEIPDTDPVVYQVKSIL